MPGKAGRRDELGSQIVMLAALASRGALTPARMRPLFDQLDEPARQLERLAQRGFGIAFWIEIVCDPGLFERFGLDDGFEQPALVGEVDVERTFGDAGGARDFVHAGPVKAQIHEHLSRAVQNLPALRTVSLAKRMNSV